MPALILTGGLAVTFGAIVCWAIVDIRGMVRDVEAASRIREHRSSFVAYVILVVLAPGALALYYGWLFLLVLLDWLGY